MNEELEMEEVVEYESDNDVATDSVEEIEEPKKETVPLHTLLEEKKRRKELEKKLREYEDRVVDSDILEERSRIAKRYTDRGYDNEIAELIAEDFANVIGKVKKSSKNDPLDEDLEDLSREDYYSDAKAYSKEIKSKISEFKKKGIELNVEDAYNLVRNPRLRQKEQRETDEQRELVARRNGDKKPIPNASSGSPKNPYPLDEVDKKALALLQRNNPNGGWTPEKYYKIKHK